MCGIAGIVSFHGQPVDLDLLQEMTDRQAHRGPDGEGFLLGWLESGGFCHALVPHTRHWDGRAPVRVALGHRRLAILDLSERGLQPMTAGDARCWIVFNGEIYNHRVLRATLEARGYTFKTRTDTEVLLQAYLAWGEECLARLQGMFAFAIWDGARTRLDGLRELLTSTIRSHLISDVRAGSCLSGGIDSSTVVSLIGKIWREQPDAAAALGDRFFTFTSCWDYPELDEREYAGTVARAVGAEPHLGFPSAQDFWQAFPRMAWHQDMPFPSLSYYAQWCVMRAAREAGVKVLLDGQGGDEVFGGYAKFRYAYLASLLRSGHLVRLAREMAATLAQGDLYVLDLRRGYRYLPKQLRRLFGVDALLQGALRADWDRAISAESTPATRWWRYAASAGAGESAATLMQRIQVDDIFIDTLPLLLRMEDRSSMAFSLEARVPLLDHQLVDYGVSLPDHLKVQNGWSKVAIREAMRGVLPDVVRRRKTKLGFAAPDKRWLARELRPQVTELIEDTLRCEKYVDAAALRRWYGSSHATDANEESYLGLFRVLALEMWMRAFDFK